MVASPLGDAHVDLVVVPLRQTPRLERGHPVEARSTTHVPDRPALHRAQVDRGRPTHADGLASDLVPAPCLDLRTHLVVGHAQVNDLPERGHPVLSVPQLDLDTPTSLPPSLAAALQMLTKGRDGLLRHGRQSARVRGPLLPPCGKACSCPVHACSRSDDPASRSTTVMRSRCCKTWTGARFLQHRERMTPGWTDELPHLPLVGGEGYAVRSG